MTDDLDQRLTALARDARAAVHISPTETEHALAEVTSGAHVARLRAAEPASGGRGTKPWVAVAAATALVVGGVTWLLTRGTGQITTVDSTVPGPDAHPTATAPTVLPTAPHTARPTVQETVPPATIPATTALPVDPFAGLARAPTGIARRCVEVARCTLLVDDLMGNVYACDPVTGVLSNTADGWEIDLELCPFLIGPGPVAYMWTSPADTTAGDGQLVAVSLTEASRGAELWRSEPFGGADHSYVGTPGGLAVFSAIPAAPQPDLSAPADFPWTFPDSTFDLPEVPVVQFVPGAGAAPPAFLRAGLRWEFSEVVRAAPAVPTDDGGMIVSAMSAGLDRQWLIRGWPDGTVSTIELPADPPDLDRQPALLERAGTVIVPDGDTFVRVDPFPARQPIQPAVDLADVLDGWNWEYSGIGRACGDVWWEQQQMTQERCTELAIDPQGIPVSYDPVTRVVTRERREGDQPVAFTLPAEYVDASLLAAGPDDVVYFSLDREWPESSDAVAFSLAPGDAGRLIERWREALPIGDADVLPGNAGLVVSGWRDPGPRPRGDAVPVVPWIARSGDANPRIADGGFDDGGNLVHANGWQWSVADRTVLGEGVGTTRVVPTFDGGFIALYQETAGDLRAELIRGWRDGHVEYAQLPVSWVQLGGLILEPQGSVLIPNGEWFARLTPFEDRPTGWDGRLEVDVEAGTATPVGLDEYLDTITWPVEGQSHVWPWGVSPVTFANAVAGGDPSSPAELRTIEQGPVDASTAVVTVTTEHFLDDSVDGVRLVMYISLDQPGFRIDRIEWSNACAPERGHQDYQAAYCT